MFFLFNDDLFNYDADNNDNMDDALRSRYSIICAYGHIWGLHRPSQWFAKKKLWRLDFILN